MTNNNRVELPIPSRGSRWTYTELEDAFPPQPPVPEERHCTIYPATEDPSSCRLKLQPTRDNNEKPPFITLLRADNPSWAYGRLLTKPAIPLDHHDVGWGKVWFAVAYRASPCTSTRSSTSTDTVGTFTAAHPPEYVAIKELSKAVVADYLLNDGPENPFVELCRLQEYSQESCVLDCWEALEDRDSLYFVSPLAVGGNLYDILFSPLVWLPAKRIHTIFVQLLNILAFLERQNIHHRDLSPDNFLLDDKDQIKVMDFALSMRIPVIDGQRTLISHVGSFGTHAYLAPEVVGENAFDGVAADLWSVMVIFYNLQTRHKLYDRPIFSDGLFRHFVIRQKLVSKEFNETIVSASPVNSPMHARAVAHLKWSTDVRELLGNTLRQSVRVRWTLAQVMESDYVRNVPT